MTKRFNSGVVPKRGKLRVLQKACLRASAGQIRMWSTCAASIRPADGSCQVAADSVGKNDCHRSSDPPDVGERWASSKVEWPPMSSLLERFFAPRSPSRSSQVPLLQRLLRCPALFTSHLPIPSIFGSAASALASPSCFAAASPCGFFSCAMQVDSWSQPQND